MAAGLASVFGTLKRAFGLVPGTLAMLLTSCGSTLLLYQNSEFRFYALLFGLAALAVNRYARFFAGDQRGLWVYAALHAGLVLTHPFGLLYSVALGFAALVSGWRERVRVWPLALAGAGGAAVFGLWLPAFLQQTAVLVADSRLPRPGPADLARVYLQVAPLVYYDEATKALVTQASRGTVVGTLAVGLMVCLLGAWCMVRVLRRGRGLMTVRPSAPGVAALLVLAGTFVLVPLGGWGLAQVGRPVFLHRYFIPSVLGFSILYAAGFAALGRRLTVVCPARGRGLAGVVAVVAGGLFAAWPLGSAARLPDGFETVRARLARLSTGEWAGLPVVCNSPPQFWPLRQYSSRMDDRCWLVLDRELAFAPDSGPAATEFNFSTVQAGFYPDLRITRTAEFLRDHRRFLVDDERTEWFQRRIQAAPERFQVEHLPGLPEHAVLVTAW